MGREKKPSKPGNYPILTRVRSTPVEKPSITIEPLNVHQRKWSVRTLDATGAKNLYASIDRWTWSGLNQTRTFQRNKDWRVLVAKGQNATYPYTRVVAAVTPVQWSGKSSGNGQTSVSDGCDIGQTLVNSPSMTALQDVAVARLKSRLNGYIGNAQLAAPLAESREIHRLVRQINGLGLDAVKAMLALKATRGKSIAKLAGDIWLGFGFGIQPMLKDIEKGANSILDYITRDDRSVRVSGTASRDYISSGLTNYGNIAEGILLDIHAAAYHRQSVRIVAGVDLKLRSAASYSVTDHLGLNISALPSTLWELMPYSWCVDYFFTVGPWLEDMFYTLPGTVKYVSQATKYQNDVVWTPRFSYNSLYKWAGSGSNGKFHYTSFTRTSLAALPYRQIRIKTADEVAMSGITKLLNLASVLAGRASPKL